MAPVFPMHQAFEGALLAAFPCEPVCRPAWPQRYAFDLDIATYLDGKRWPDVVGFQLVKGERDLSLSSWLAILPVDAMCYYLPSHLLFASLLLPGGAHPNYVGQVMEALVLPPDASPAQLDVIDREMCLEAPLRQYGEARVGVYRALLPAQRRAVALWLDLYEHYCGAEFTAAGHDLFRRNRDAWCSEEKR